MNTQGWQRGLMAQNMDNGKHLRFVVNCLEREFEVETKVNKQGQEYLIKFMDYELKIDEVEVKKLQDCGSYVLDKFLLDQLRNKGFVFDVNRSQFVQYCYGIYQ
jgi:hypothetical protein